MIRSKPNSVRIAFAALIVGLTMSACGKSSNTGANAGSNLGLGTGFPGGTTTLPGGGGCMQVGPGAVIPFILQGAQVGATTLTASQGQIALGGGGAGAQFSNQWRTAYGMPAGSFNLVQIQLQTAYPNQPASGMGMMQLSQADASTIMSAGGYNPYNPYGGATQGVCVTPVALSTSFSGTNLTVGRLYLQVYANGQSIGTYQANF